MNLFAQEPIIPGLSWDGTILTLLAIVLGAVGYGLRTAFHKLTEVVVKPLVDRHVKFLDRIESFMTSHEKSLENHDRLLERQGEALEKVSVTLEAQGRAIEALSRQINRQGTTKDGT